MKLRFAPFWYDRFPASRRPAFPRQRGILDTEVVIVGGGLTGCACAFACAAARIPVVLVDGGRIGEETGGGAAGLVREDFDGRFGEAAGRHGLRTARTMWEALRRAAGDLPAAIRRLKINGDLSRQDLLWIAPPDGQAVKALRREYDSREAAGLGFRWIRASAVTREAALAAGGAIRTRGTALDPYRACLGFARAADARGALLFQGTEVRRVRSTRAGVEVITAAGTVRAKRVVMTTGPALPDLRPLRRHLHPRHGYAVVTEPLAGPVRRQLGSRALAIRDGAVPPHVVRWLKDDRVLIEGGDQDPVAARSQRRAIVQRTGQLMYELSLLYPAISGTQPAWAWSFGFDDTVDGLPCIGPHRSFPRHLFALGLGRHGVAAAWLAARILFRQLNGESAKGDEAFGFSRLF